MREDHRFQRKGGLSEEGKRMLPVILIPLIVILLMIVIVIADHSKEKAVGTAGPEPSVREAQEPASGPAESDDAGGPEDGAEPAGNGETDASEGSEETEASQSEDAQEAAEPSLLQQDSVPEIRDLMERYYQARATADAAAINQIYGVGEVPAYMLEIQKVRLANNAKYLSGISNVVTYVADGKSADSWLVYSTADLQFYGVKTAAPMIMWCYVEKDAEGTYHILDNAALSEDVLQYIDAANRSREVRQLAAGINARLKEALSSDEELNEIYGILHDGSPVWTEEGETEPEVVILEGESTEEPETESEADGESAAETEAASETTQGESTQE